MESYKKIHLIIDYLKKSQATSFEAIWKDAEIVGKQLDIDDPVLPRKRKVPAKLGGGDINYELTPKTHYLNIYNKCYESILESFDVRFKSETQRTHVALENFLLGKESKDEKCNIETLYKEDFDFPSFYTHRQMFFEFVKILGGDITCTSDVREFFIAHSETKGLCPMCTKFVELLLTIPGSSCTNERSFSLMRRVKTYLRSTMGQQRLNNISILAAYRELSDQTNMAEIVDDFINQNNLRKATFAISNK